MADNANFIFSNYFYVGKSAPTSASDLDTALEYALKIKSGFDPYFKQRVVSTFLYKTTSVEAIKLPDHILQVIDHSSPNPLLAIAALKSYQTTDAEIASLKRRLEHRERNNDNEETEEASGAETTAPPKKDPNHDFKPHLFPFLLLASHG